MKIKETVVVEGRDDTRAVRAAVDCLTLETHGYGIRPETWDLIAEASERTGIIIFTDPDHAGEQIRRRIKARFPDSREAFLPRDKATKDGDIGIENADPESIREALAKARSTGGREDSGITMADLAGWGLCGREDSAARREALGARLGTGHANGKTLLRRLRAFGITAAEVEAALEDMDKEL
ncbi:MAG: ribonuclease M5 [Lentihominibacter sp.]